METILRVAVIYVFVLFGLRVLGKREFGELSPFELVTLLLIPELATQALLREDFSLTNAIVGISTLFVLVFITSVISHKSHRIESVLEGRPTVLVSNGAFVPENMNRERVTPGEVYGELHRSGYSRLEQVRWAILESDGRISVVPYETGERPIRPKDRLPK